MTAPVSPDQLADILARLDRVEALVARHVEPVDFLTPALRRFMRDGWFTAGEIWRLADAQAKACASIGEPEPESTEALRLEGIRSPHGPGRWIAEREGRGFERAAASRQGVLWRCL